MGRELQEVPAYRRVGREASANDANHSPPPRSAPTGGREMDAWGSAPRQRDREKEAAFITDER